MSGNDLLELDQDEQDLLMLLGGSIEPDPTKADAKPAPSLDESDRVDAELMELLGAGIGDHGDKKSQDASDLFELLSGDTSFDSTVSDPNDSMNTSLESLLEPAFKIDDESHDEDGQRTPSPNRKSSDSASTNTDNRIDSMSSSSQKEPLQEDVDPDEVKQVSEFAHITTPEALQEQLITLLSAADVSEPRVRDLCRTYMFHAKASDANAAAPSLNIPLLPVNSPLRPKLWLCLLGCLGKDTAIAESWDEKLDLDNQKVIRIDCDRTRPDEPEFEAHNGALRDRLERMLTLYCKARGVIYKQGLNEIVAPVLACFEDRADGEIYNCVYSIISRFLPSIFNDTEFESLQCIMRLFNLLILYHDPMLSNLLTQFHMLPELYATAWFITLFARKLKLGLVYSLWDVYIVENDPFLHYFVALALLVKNKDHLLQVNQDNLPQALGALRITSLEDIKALVKQAKHFRAHTPVSFREQLYNVSFELKDSKTVTALSKSISDLPCLSIPAKEVVEQYYHQHLEDGAIKYLVLDCRTSAEFNSGHLPCAMHLSPALLDKPEKMLKKLQELSLMKGCHFCILGSGEERGLENEQFVAEDASARFLMHFWQKGFPLVSRCQGGYLACHQLVLDLGGDLIDHNKRTCRACTARLNRISTVTNALGVVGSNVFRSIKTKAKQANASGQLKKIWSWGSSALKNVTQKSKQTDTRSEKAPTEVNAKIDLAGWAEVPEITFFSCRRVARRRDTKSPSFHPAFLAVSDGYVTCLEPLDPQLRRLRQPPDEDSGPMSPVPKGVTQVESYADMVAMMQGQAYMKSKHRISDLEKITSKKKMPRVLSFHWKLPEAKRAVHVYTVDKYKECISLVKAKFSATAPHLTDVSEGRKATFNDSDLI